jgi:hypothetical protein
MHSEINGAQTQCQTTGNMATKGEFVDFSGANWFLAEPQFPRQSEQKLACTAGECVEATLRQCRQK